MEKFNIKITHNNKEWLVYCLPVTLEECKDTFIFFARKYKNQESINVKLCGF